MLKNKLSIKKIANNVGSKIPHNINSPDTQSIKSTQSTDSKKSETQSPKRAKEEAADDKSQVKEEEEESEEAESEEEVDDESDQKTKSTSEQDLLPNIKKNPPDEIALTSLNLGILFGFALATLLLSNYKPPSIYLMSLAIFHFLEFYITAKYNPKKVHKESFIINNGSSYTVAHSIALIEVTLGYIFFPNVKKSFLWIRIIGFLLIVGGQIIRSWAMITAGKSFSHLIVTNRSDDHELVTHGIYSVFRHPSYAGFFWWAIGTQLILINPISLIGFIAILWVFFSNRIVYEEKYLVTFFGDKYEDYRKSTSVYIPFIE